MKMAINISISNDGQVTADVVGGKGHACIDQLLAGLDELLGKAEVTKLKPEYQWRPEVAQTTRRQEAKT